MKVKFKKRVSLGGYSSFAPGDVDEINNIHAKELISAGIAEEYNEKEEKKPSKTKERKTKPKTK